MGKERYIVINSVLLSKEEIEFSISKLKRENVPFTSAEDALRLAKINVLSKDMKIIYIIKIPLTLSETFKGIIVRPVKKMNNIIIETKYKEILKGKDKLYGIKNKCETYNDLMICKEADVIDISNDLCISRIINSLNSTCNTTNDHHIPTIEKINKGVILLNKFSGKIEADKMAQEINGTHVVIFYNATIRINNKEYSNIEVMPITSIPAILQPTPLEKDHIEILSLESLKDLHINNTHRINSLKKATLSIGGLISITSVITIALFILLKKKSIKIQYIEKEVSKPKAGSPPQESNDIPTYVKFNDLPFY